MLIVDMIRRGRIQIPDFLYDRRFYLRCEVGKPNGTSLSINFMDEESNTCVYVLQLPQQYVQDFIREYLECILMEWRLNPLDGLTFEEMQAQLAKYDKTHYTTHIDFRGGGLQDEEDNLDRPVEVRQFEELREVRLLDNALAEPARLRRLADLYRNGQAGVPYWPPAAQDQPLPDGRAGGALGGAAIDAAEAGAANDIGANGRDVPIGW